METKQNNFRMNQCKMFESCSAPICPLDEFASERVYLEEDDICPYCRRNTKKGTRKSMPEELRKLVSDKNVALLRQKNR